MNVALYMKVHEYTLNEREPVRVKYLGFNWNIKRVLGYT
jgi:hypothetical protein